MVVLLLIAVIVQWGCVPSEDGKGTESSKWGRIKIVLDPGHGGIDVGASPDGAPFEKGVVLDIALRVERLLERKGLQVTLTRRTDEFIPLPKRASMANDEHGTLFVSIHANSCPRKEVRGFEIYYSENGRERQSVQAANFLQQTLKKATGANDRGIRKQNYAVLARTKCPAVLIEVGYLSNPREANLLSKGSYRKKVAQGIAKGIAAYAKTRL